jgi:hypothetical protein
LQRLGAANATKLHLSRTFKLSKHKHIEVKSWDVIGFIWWARESISPVSA